MAGIHTVRWNGTNTTGAGANNGIYYYVLKTGDTVTSGKIILLR
jgi:flagellar hook assembly protein FlgD